MELNLYFTITTAFNQFVAYFMQLQIKGIFAYGIGPELNKESWCEIIGLGPAHTPGNGVFENIKELLPGHFMEITW